MVNGDWNFTNYNKKKQIKALIVGKVVCRSQIAMARALEMTRFKKPPNTLELVAGLLSLYEIIINEFGKEAFFSHGGNRKSEKKEDKAKPQSIHSEHIGIKKVNRERLVEFRTPRRPLWPGRVALP